jgi:CBS-domain-containing membrane protein
MTRDVVTIDTDRPIREIARLLLDRRISAAPVVDARGKLIGIVSEGDLLRRVETDTERRRSIWRRFLASGADLAGEYVKSHGKRAADIMTKNVVAVGEDAPLDEIADLFEDHNIKRVPVVRDGAVLGIVSRADLLRVLVAAPAGAPESELDDGSIRDALTAELRHQKWARSIGVHIEVSDGVVRLSGTVPPSEAQRAALRVAAERITGVRKVEDTLSTVAARLDV